MRKCAASLGATQLDFAPGPIAHGDYEFKIGTAGSTSLVLQTLLPALLSTAGESRIAIEGGTHNEHAPTFDYIDRVYLPTLARLGVDASVELERCGFYPAGGGRVVLDVTSSGELEPIELLSRGPRTGLRGHALLSNLPPNIGHRELLRLTRKLPLERKAIRVEEVASPGPGNVVWVEVECRDVREVFTGFGQLGRSAERGPAGRRALGRSTPRSTRPRRRRPLSHDTLEQTHDDESRCQRPLRPVGRARRTTW